MTVASRKEDGGGGRKREKYFSFSASEWFLLRGDAAGRA